MKGSWGRRRLRQVIDRRGQDGYLAFLVVMMLALLAILPPLARMMQSSSRQTRGRLNYDVQAQDVARAGLTDALTWFIRQPGQPVTVFAPSGNPRPDGAVDTLVEGLGLVKEYPLGEASGLMARYEVPKQGFTTPPSFPDTPVVMDVSALRQLPAAGSAWELWSRGIVFRKRGPPGPFDPSVDQVISRRLVSTEIRRITVNLPWNAAVLIGNASGSRVETNNWVDGGTDRGVVYRTGTTANWAIGTRTLGAQASFADGGLDLGTQAVFSAAPREIAELADYTVGTVDNLPADYPDMALVYIDGDAVFSQARPLRGGGILFINGNLTIPSLTGSWFSGVAYVTGNVTMSGPAILSGCLVVPAGNLLLQTGPEPSRVLYDSTSINRVRQSVGTYRENRTLYRSAVRPL